MEVSHQRLGVITHSFHNYPLSIIIPPNLGEVIFTFFLENASSVTDLQLTSFLFQGVPQFERVA